MEHQNGAVIRKTLFEVGHIEIYCSFIRVIQIWSYLKPGLNLSDAVLKSDTIA